ncbi:ABC transporter permease [Natrarchaeobius chitinivorans]|uniref:ABC transporter permease subunit n=1 Tax=Natrarchaeobius chitinivorans TaxID=1679083 RepID=A0A3N6N8V2_NATCH|nr:ABC transporter permease subunit [Natrarchaeobius chitinivorans]RQG94922.1 ABC transporter permease subunit [Natrarchaeobius chitinivorans]
MSAKSITSLDRLTDVTARSILVNISQRVRKQIHQIVLPLLGMIVLWQLAAMYVSDPMTLPTPMATFEQTYLLATTPDFRGLTALDHLRYTFVRAIVVSVIALSIATVFGVLMTTNKSFEEGLSNVLPFAMTVPTVVIILLSMIWFNFGERAVIFATVIAATPFGIINMWQGAKDIDVDLITMAHSFDASTAMVWRHIYIPHLLPYLFGSYRYILGMVWKIVILAEVFGIENGFGAMFRYYFQMGELVVMLGYLMLFVAVVLIIEYAVLKPLEEYLFRWRG